MKVTSGIGKATAFALAEKGYHVVLGNALLLPKVFNVSVFLSLLIYFQLEGLLSFFQRLFNILFLFFFFELNMLFLSFDVRTIFLTYDRL